MKKDSSKTVHAKHLTMVCVCLLFISCFSPFDGEEGNLIITLPGHSIARSAVPSTGTQSQLAYDITCTNGDQTKIFSALVGQTTVVLRLVPGTWDVTARPTSPTEMSL
jgi:hypothetical protein